METAKNIWEAVNALLKPLQNDLANHAAKQLKSKTIESYQHIYDRIHAEIGLEKKHFLIDVIKNTASKNTYFSRIAAIKFINLQSIQQQINIVNIAVRDQREQDAFIAFASLRFLAQEWHEIASYLPKCDLLNKRPRQSKRIAVAGLPSDWREKLYLRMCRGKFGIPMLVAAISGCRPAELVSCINVSQKNTDGDNELLITIFGSKVTSENGQPVRTLTFQTKNAPFLISILNTITNDNGGQINVKIQNPKAFSSAITKYCRLLWPKHKHDVTAYCLRHAAASDWKSTLTSEELAIALGHASTRTQKTYGQRQQSKNVGAMVPICVNGMRQVRVSENNFTNQDSRKNNYSFEPT